MVGRHGVTQAALPGSGVGWVIDEACWLTAVGGTSIICQARNLELIERLQQAALDPRYRHLDSTAPPVICCQEGSQGCQPLLY